MRTMKMKPLRLLILAFILSLALPLSAYAAEDDELYGSGPWTSNDGTEFYMPYVDDTSSRIFDYADLLSDEGEEAISSRIQDLQYDKYCDIFILTSNDVPMDINYGTETTSQYVEQFYMDNGFDEDCLAMIFDMNNRVIYTMGHGKYASDKYVRFHEDVYNDALSYASSGDFYGAMDKFLDYVYRLDNVGVAAIPTLRSLVISLILSLVALVVLLGKHSFSQPDHSAKTPVKPLGFKRVVSRSSFMGKHVTRHVIERSSRSGGGGGFSGGTHSGGGFSGGGGGFSGGGGHF